MVFDSEKEAEEGNRMHRCRSKSLEWTLSTIMI